MENSLRECLESSGADTAQVVLLVNLDSGAKLANGTRGEVLSSQALGHLTVRPNTVPVAVALLSMVQNLVMLLG